MEFTRLRGFWKSKATKRGDDENRGGDVDKLEGETEFGCKNKSKTTGPTTPKFNNEKDNNFKIISNTRESNSSSEQSKFVLFRTGI